MQEVLEQQHQHDVDAQHPGQHRQAEAREQLAHHLGVADLDHLDAGRQLPDRRQLLNRCRDIAQRQPRQLDLEVDVARAVVTVDQRGTASEFQRGDLRQHHRAAGAGNGKASEQRQVLARRRVELHDDRNLSLGQVELGQRHIVIAGGGNTQCLAYRSAGHAEVGRLRKVGTHHDLGSYQARAGSHAAQAGNRPQVFLNGQRGGLQRQRVLGSEHQNVFFSGAAEPDPAANARQGLERRTDRIFDSLLAWPLVALVEQNRERRLARLGGALHRERVAARAAATHRGVDTLHMRHAGYQPPRVLGCGFGLEQRCARRQLQIDLGLRVVVGWYEAGRQQRDQRHRAEEEQGRCGHGAQAVRQTPARADHVHPQPEGVPRRANDGLEHIGRHHRRENTRHQQRRDDCQGCSPAKLLEKLPRDAAHERGGQEHRHQGEGGGDHRQPDLIGGLHRRLVWCLSHAQVAHDVLDLDDRVVDQNADHQRQRQQSDHVDAETQKVHPDESRDHRQRQRHRRHQGCTPVAQEQPHHQHRQHRTFKQQVH